MKQQIYWHTTVQMPDDSNLMPIPADVDFAIIGGGLLGARKLNEAPRGPTTRKAPASPGPRPDPKIGATITTETPEERKRRLRAESLRK